MGSFEQFWGGNHFSSKMVAKMKFATTIFAEKKDAKIVLAVSDKYREGQDYLTEFAKEKILAR